MALRQFVLFGVGQRSRCILNQQFLMSFDAGCQQFATELCHSDVPGQPGLLEIQQAHPPSWVGCPRRQRAAARLSRIAAWPEPHTVSAGAGFTAKVTALLVMF